MGEPATLDAILDVNIGKHDAKLYFDLRHAILAWSRARELRYGERVREVCAQSLRDRAAQCVVRMTGLPPTDERTRRAIRQDVGVEDEPLPEPETEAT